MAAWANFSEDFEGYGVGALTPQTSIWNGASSWSVVDDGGNKVVALSSGAEFLRYAGTESFIGSGAGYTMFFKIKYNGNGATPRSGLVIDQKAETVNAYNGRRLEMGGIEQDGMVDVYTGWGTSTGTGGTVANAWNYVRVYRSGMDASSNEGGSLQIYVSATPFSVTNTGTLIFDKTGRGGSLVPDTDPFASVGKFSLWGLNVDPTVSFVYFDDIAAYSGNVAWPAPIAVCGDSNHPKPVVDLNGDCYVNIGDLAIIAQNWLACTDPLPPCSYNP